MSRHRVSSGYHTDVWPTMYFLNKELAKRMERGGLGELGKGCRDFQWIFGRISSESPPWGTIELFGESYCHSTKLSIELLRDKERQRCKFGKRRRCICLCLCLWRCVCRCLCRCLCWGTKRDKGASWSNGITGGSLVNQRNLSDPQFTLTSSRSLTEPLAFLYRLNVRYKKIDTNFKMYENF